MSLFLSAGISDCGGSTLLDEVLAHFTDISPAELRSVRSEQPKISAWSSPAWVQRRRGQRGQGMLRKYEVQVADRGQGNCCGRPGPSPSPSPPPLLSQTPSPTLGSNGSDQGNSRPASRAESRTHTPMSQNVTRDCPPRSSQQFPILVASTWASSPMSRPASQQSQHNKLAKKFADEAGTRQEDTPGKKHGREDKPTWKHLAKPGLFGKHFGNEAEDHGDISEGHAGRHESVAFASTLRESVAYERPDSRRKATMRPENETLPSSCPSPRRQISLAESLDSSMSTGRRITIHGASRSGPDSVRSTSPDKSASPRRSDGPSGKIDDSLKDSVLDIWSINLPSSKYDRMQRLRNCRKLKAVQTRTGDRDKVVTKDEVERAEQAFHKWFSARANGSRKSLGSKKTFCRKNMVNALSDFGIRACGGQEKAVLSDIFEEHASTHFLAFTDFCDIAEQARLRLRSSRFCAFSRAWQQIDTDDVGSLTHAQVLQLLAEFKLAPQTPEDAAALEASMEELHKDASSGYPLFEVEHLFQRCRERVASQRRALEHQIRAQYFMFRSAFADSHDQIIEFHDAFKHFDVRDSGRLGPDEVLYLLGEFGICQVHTPEQRNEFETDLREFLDSQTEAGQETSMTFPWFLLFVKTLREVRTKVQHELVAPIFTSHNKYKKCELGMKEVCDIIEELELQPQTQEEQDSIGELLEDLDENGTALFNLEQVVQATSRIIEQRAQQLRCAENAKAASLNVSRRLKFELRRAFETLDVDGKATLTFPQIIKAVEMMKWRIADSKIREVLDEVDEDGTETIDFIEFMELMSKIDREMKAAAERERSMSDEEIEPRRSSAREEARTSSNPHVEVGGSHGTTGGKMQMKPSAPSTRRGFKPPPQNRTTRFKRNTDPFDRAPSKDRRTRYNSGKTAAALGIH